eukprot:CAMPEP_0175143274 /NCGR_PEP_ID=MMETSP0087-20121206/13330_1 /TAXON_ID=136419 /ORGANISM="Unknown Unknown, Strain D1" /LENGTH=268 /DNA_ID=CAMNT_0016427303 /DNA_START=63 /DNA_END=868 /DNA_ORIENTATION=+
MTSPPLQEGCPWAGWARPNVKWCENNLCAWITTPANTWSNLAYIVLGLYMLLDAKSRTNKHKTSNTTLFYIGWASIVVGLCSFAYHASYTAFFQWGDFVGMYIFGSVPAVLNLRRFHIVTHRQQLRVAVLLVLFLSLLTALLQQIKFPIQLVIVAIIGTTLAQETFLFLRERTAAQHSNKKASASLAPNRAKFVQGIVFLFLGGTCSFLDVTNRWCDPDNHVIQGHALWHVLTAWALLCLYKFYASNFDLEKDAVPSRGGLQLLGSVV